MNTLNPRWNDFLFDAHELNGNDKELKLMFQIYDDDGKKGADAKDKLIGTGYFNLKELEAACMMQAPLAINDGKRSKPAGYLIVNSYKEHGAAQGPPGPKVEAILVELEGILQMLEAILPMLEVTLEDTLVE